MEEIFDIISKSEGFSKYYAIAEGTLVNGDNDARKRKTIERAHVESFSDENGKIYYNVLLKSDRLSENYYNGELIGYYSEGIYEAYLYSEGSDLVIHYSSHVANISEDHIDTTFFEHDSKQVYDVKLHETFDERIDDKAHILSNHSRTLTLN